MTPLFSSIMSACRIPHIKKYFLYPTAEQAYYEISLIAYGFSNKKLTLEQRFENFQMACIQLLRDGVLPELEYKYVSETLETTLIIKIPSAPTKENHDFFEQAKIAGFVETDMPNPIIVTEPKSIEKQKNRENPALL